MRNKNMLIIGLAVTSMLFGCQQNNTSQTAQDFSFRTLSGETKTLASLKGKPVVVNFFGIH